ncbi:3-oxoacyl-[acyl-carrier-protein] reductase FabG [Terrihabitans soli]|uniref:3-oxoacyl-[acyl-carrier-protein] reductase FabG n=1 Tax=Terrihabitans soli TaxID=708113 RepID=A0A6S6QM62_9HYPH|nr:SDR family oxidoreductase [Terrihabitans soli]BCJ90446.1 3-oxoacyl-[acyl-carrier-protein] reductase FabG [Terrihabitans soli]
MTKPLKDKVAIVTGSARNIGRTIAFGLAEDGASVVVNARSSREETEALAEEIRKAGGKAVAVLADVSVPEEAAGLIADAVRAFGRVDILVNNAAMRRENPIADISFEEWREVLASVLDGSFLCARAASRHMGEGGRIINIGGLSAHTGAINRAHVVTAKAGLVGLTKALAIELAPRHITANLVAPGRISTDRRKTGVAQPAHHAHHSSPLGMEGSVDDVADMVRHLAGPAGRYITGQTLHVNGGIYLP